MVRRVVMLRLKVVGMKLGRSLLLAQLRLRPLALETWLPLAEEATAEFEVPESIGRVKVLATTEKAMESA